MPSCTATPRGNPQHCFAAPTNEPVVTHEPKIEAKPYGENAAAVEAAAAIVREAKITEGYCVDLGCGDGALAFELARATKLTVVAIDPDPAKVELARKKLDAAGLYGTRVMVHVGDSARSPYPRYFANLVVSACGCFSEDGARRRGGEPHSLLLAPASLGSLTSQGSLQRRTPKRANVARRSSERAASTASSTTDGDTDRRSSSARASS